MTFLMIGRREFIARMAAYRGRGSPARQGSQVNFVRSLQADTRSVGALLSILTRCSDGSSTILNWE